MPGSTKRQRSVSVSVNGAQLGVFDTFSGGDVDSDPPVYHEGAMQPAVVLADVATPQDITVARLYRLERDHNQAILLSALVGKASCVVKDQPLDPDGNPFGQPRTYTGKLKNVAYPEGDSSSNDPSMLTLVIRPDGTVS